MTHDECVYHHLYVESKSPLENAERIASLEELVEGLQAENAKLRSQCTDLVNERERLFQANVEKNGEVLRLVNENAKLRELCKRALRNCYDAYEQVWGWDDDWVILCDEARKLGIGVTE